jgi:choline dehydrogenase
MAELILSSAVILLLMVSLLLVLRWCDVSEPPSILFNYLQHEEDRQAWRQCIHLTREIMSQPAMHPFRGSELQPGTDVQSDAEIAAWLRQNVESAYHPAGTCKMGPATDNRAVVDPECRVHGLENLRVVDASIFPTVPNGNINAPVIMVAEKISDKILGLPALPKAEVPLHLPDNWETQQR